MNARNLSIAIAVLIASCAGRPQAREDASATPQPVSMAVGGDEAGVERPCFEM